MLKVSMCACAAVALAATSAMAGGATQPEKVSFYFAAHADDWQLFMNPSAFDDVIDGAAKTVFVHLTAGDAGLGTGGGGRKHPFYLAREHGAESAIRFMADADKVPVDKTTTMQLVNDHPIYRVAYRNTVSYFMRVPDGHGSGSGYAETGYQSLKRFADHRIATLTAVDGSTVYKGWDDLVATIKALIQQERGSASVVQMNVPELDQRINPGDHSDHQMTAKAALDAAATLDCVRKVHYVDYASGRLPENLNAIQRDRESAVFAVTLAGVLALDHGVSWHHYDKTYVGRNYFRVEEPAGNCRPNEPMVAVAKHVKTGGPAPRP
jgi:hypothetical protein